MSRLIPPTLFFFNVVLAPLPFCINFRVILPVSTKNHVKPAYQGHTHLSHVVALASRRPFHSVYFPTGRARDVFPPLPTRHGTSLWLCQPDSKQLSFHSILQYQNWTSPLTLLHLFFQNHLFLILCSFLNWDVFFFRIYDSSFSCFSSLGSVHLSSGLETSRLAVGVSCQFQGGSGCPSVCWCSLSATELCPGFLTCRIWSGLPGGLCAPPW